MRCIKNILFSLLSCSLLLGLFFTRTEFNVHASTSDNILEDIKNNDFVDIQKIELDSNNQVYSIEDININSKSINLKDGTYLIDRGYGWVLGNDASFIESGFANPNEYLRLVKAETVVTQHHIMSGASAGLDFGIVKTAIEVTYQHTITEQTNLIMGFEMTAPADKNIYVKTYSTYRRFDMFKIENGSLKGHSATYEPNGTWAKYVTYNPGETLNQNALKETVARNVMGAPQLVEIDNTIHVAGCDYVRSVDIVLNSNRSIELLNRTNTPIHRNYGSQEYFTIELIGANNKTKASMKMNGNDYSNDSKFDYFDRTVYEIGDLLKITHKEPYLIDITGNVTGENIKNSTVQLYKITENGLEGIKPPIEPTIYNIMPKLRPSSVFVRNYSGLGVRLEPNFDKNSDASKWEFIYEPSKQAYKIRNVETNKFLVDAYFNDLYAVDEPNDDSKYFKIETFSNNEISMINLKTNKAITWKSYGISPSLDSIKDLKDYTRSNEQKFTIEAR